MDEDGSVAITGMSIAGLSIVDPDAALAPGSIYVVTLSAGHGTLTVGTAELGFAAGDGTSDATMTFHGTLADINAALASGAATRRRRITTATTA